MNKIKTVGIISPSIMLSDRPLHEDKWQPYLESCGLKVVWSPSATKGTYAYNGYAQEKAKDIMDMYANPEIDALVSAHGGAGALNVLEYLDFDFIAKHPKPIIGFSDNTSMQLAVYAKTHQPFVTGFFLEYAFRNGDINPLVDADFRKIIQGEKMSYQSGETVNGGVAEGVLLGECLSPISDLNGTPYYPDISDAILLIEDEEEQSYKLGLMLTQLRYNPNFKKVKGIVFGKFADCIDHKTQGSVEKIIADFCSNVDVPIVKDFNFGHFAEHHVLPMGVKYRFDANNCLLVQQEDL
ncbi:MAG: LD-carboxypeptidase [Alphaproteobacteria bacterium]|nr:LD-carboxypeptidase [Alphaproteobacteria bacterium]